MIDDWHDFEKVGDLDLMAAALGLETIDPSLLYAVPQERIRHFRRKIAAEKASAVRKARATPVTQRLLQIAHDEGLISK